MSEETKTDVVTCARCGGKHDALTFKKLTRPFTHGGTFEWWAPCPTNGEPILMRRERLWIVATPNDAGLK